MWFDSYERQRSRMVQEQLRARGIHDERVLEAMLRVPRHEFVAPQFRNKAYGDFPVPVAAEQTVSQPYIVAAMVQALDLKGSETVLEIGTGTGYQAAVLSLIARFVYSIERHSVLAQAARENLIRLGFTNTQVLTGDGTLGLPEHAPFDAIIVAAAAPMTPQALIDQLASGGRMVLPVGTRESQVLELIRKQDDQVFTTMLEGCRFVPLVGASGFEE